MQLKGNIKRIKPRLDLCLFTYKEYSKLSNVIENWPNSFQEIKQFQKTIYIYF